MKLPAITSIASSLDGVTGFTGYNHNKKIGTTEFYDQQNITSESLPVVTPRHRRGIVRTLEKANGLFVNDKLGWVDGTTLYYDGTPVILGLTDTEKTVLRMGARIIVFPDKVYFNTRTLEFGTLDAHYNSGEAIVTAVISKADGTPYSDYTLSGTAPSDPDDGDLWLDNSENTLYLKQYSEDTSSWTSVATVYVKVSAPGIGEKFSEYDGVTIGGMDDDSLNGDFFLIGSGTDYIIVTAIIGEAITGNSGTVSVSRTVPDMDFITECNNRLWGCSSATNEIYACTLGDPKNWNQFMGLSTDSYALNLGSAGAFTGAATHLGTPLFFKEDVIHQIVGTEPSNFTLSDTGARGIASGSAKSARVVNEVLYYLAPNDVCAFSQSLPISVSDALGNEHYKNAVGGSCGQLYYLCVEKGDGTHVLFTYDTEASIWSKEDDVNARWFATVGNELYFIAGNTIYSVRGTLDYGDSAVLEPPVQWMVETGDIGIDAPYNKYITGIQLHVELEVGSSLAVQIQYDGAGSWEEIFRNSKINPQKMVVPIATKRCRTIKLRITGTGDCSLFSLVKRTAAGSDVYAV